MPPSGRTSPSNGCPTRDNCQRFAIRGSGNRWTRCAIECSWNSCGTAPAPPGRSGEHGRERNRAGTLRTSPLSRLRDGTASRVCRPRKISPIANDFLRADQLEVSERIYPLCVYVCENCLLVQIEQFETPDTIFNADYAYFSSFSDSWVQHARDYADMMVRALSPGRLTSSHRNRVERWLPAPMVPTEGHTGSRHRTVRQDGAGRRGEGHPVPHPILRHEPRGGVGDAGSWRRPAHRQ